MNEAPNRDSARQSARSSLAKAIGLFIPPVQWRTAVLMISGAFAGLVFTLFQVSGGISYFSSDPEACINCHLMTPQFSRWERNSHRTSATCVECHLPQDNPVHNLVAKADAGLLHMWVYATRTEPFVIKAREVSRKNIRDNCLRCHGDILSTTALVEPDMGIGMRDERACWECHTQVGHGSPNSLASAPNALWLPMATHRVAPWITKAKAASER